jgi:hypothetical protein
VSNNFRQRTENPRIPTLSPCGLLKKRLRGFERSTIKLWTVPEPVAPAGWYPDSQSNRHWRWWDGARWTQHSAPRFSPVPVDPSRIRPRAWAFALAAVPAVLGLAAAVVLALGAINAGSSTFDRLTAPLTQFDAPGSAAVSLRAGETRTIYTPAMRGGSAAASTSSDLSCVVLGQGGVRGRPTPNESMTLQQGGTDYRSLFDFTAPVSGTSRVLCRPSSNSRNPVPLAIGPRFEVSDVLGIVGRAVGAFFALILGLGMGGGVGALVGVRRDRSKRQLQAEAGETPPPRAPPEAA